MGGPESIIELLQSVLGVAFVLVFFWINRWGPTDPRYRSTRRSRTRTPPRVLDRAHPLWDDWLDG